jgi:hypothetical protein
MRSAHNCAGKMLLIVTAILIVTSPTAFARVGETALQFVDRYGSPQDTPATRIMDKNMPLLEGAVHHHYEYQGWRIRAAFMQLDGPAVRMEYSKTAKTGDMTIKDYELQAIMTANTPPGTSWKQTSVDNPDLHTKGLTKFAQSYFAGALGEKMWQRTDGAILWLRSKLIVRLELPIAREYEAQLKAEKEQKVRDSVPQF